MGFFTRKSKRQAQRAIQEKLEQAYKMSTSNRVESDRLTKEANDILEKLKRLAAEA